MKNWTIVKREIQIFDMFLNKSKYFGKRKCVRNSGIYRVSRPYVGLNSHEIT